MLPVTIAIAIHVGMGVLWALASLAVAATGRARPSLLKGLLGIALVSMLAGIYLWHALHSGPWGTTERLLAIGTFCAFIAFGLQAPVALTAAGDGRRLSGPSLAIYRISAIVLLATAALMLGSRYG